MKNKNNFLKRTLSFVLSLVMIASIMAIAPASAGAVEITRQSVQSDDVYWYSSGDYNYSLLDDNTAQIEYYSGSATVLTVPSTLGGYKVTSIGDYAYSDCSSLTSVTIPDSITSIGGGAFYDCTSLTSVTIPDSVTSIGNSAFSRCSSLTSVTIPDSVTSIGEWAFDSCTSLTSVTIPDSVTSIGDYAFWDCTSLTSVTVNGGTIGDAAFEECTSLKSVTIGSSVTSIGEFAFYDCGLTSVTIPNTVKTIGDYSFYNDDYYDNKLIMYGYTGSAAETYAKNNSYTVTFSALNKLAAPKLTSVSNTTKGVAVKWNKVSGATKYRVYYKGGSVKSWKKAGDTTGTSYTVTGLSSGTKYTFTVKAVSPSAGKYDTTGKSIKYLAAGKVSSLANTSKGITVKWNKVAGASGYYVYRKTSGGSYSRIKTITSGSTTSYTDTAVKSKNGTTYIYAVRPYSGSIKGSYTGKGTVRLTGISLSSVKNTSGKKLSVKWKTNSKATGYQIQYSTSSDFKSAKTVTISKKSTSSKTITGLTKNKKYYVRIRAYKTVSGKNYFSAWTKYGKTVKISK